MIFLFSAASIANVMHVFVCFECPCSCEAFRGEASCIRQQCKEGGSYIHVYMLLCIHEMSVKMYGYSFHFYS